MNDDGDDEEGNDEQKLTELSEIAAKALTQYKGICYLSGLKELSDAAANSLAKMDPDKISLPEELNA